MIHKPKKIKWKDKYWDILSLWVRRDGICIFHEKLKEKGIESPCSCNGALQACHKISRSKLAVKYDERNLFCGCAGSNTWSHYNEVEWNLLWKALWPEDVEYLESHKNDKAKFSAWWYKMEIDKLKFQLLNYKGSHF